jgi:two-component system chemotaxis response regulator CheY
MTQRCKDLHFLVVDDSKSMRRIIIRTLKEMGCAEAHEASSAHIALDLLDREHVDFIISDWNMPGMKGIEFLIHVRAADKYKDLPFLMVSAEAKTENLMEAIKAGVSNYLTKPFTPELLQRKIEAILDASC